MTAVRVPLPRGHEEGVRSSLKQSCGFDVRDDCEGWVLVALGEDAGTPRRYFEADRIADANTALDDPRAWDIVQRRPPYSPKPEVGLPANAAEAFKRLLESQELSAVIERTGAVVGLSDADGLPAVWRQELPQLFDRYPDGSLWYVTVDDVLVRRLAFMRVRLQLELLPDAKFGTDERDGVRYFGMHTITGGVGFGGALQHPLLAFAPTSAGFVANTFPHVFVFLFGRFEDLRTRSPGPLARKYFPDVSSHGSVPGIKVPVDGLAVAHIESLLQWWMSRLNVLYSHASDPTNFASDGVHDPVAQAAWFFTMERLLADATALLASVDSPALLRMQAAFDLLDKADSLLTKPGAKVTGRGFKRLLRRSEMVPRLTGAYRHLPLQLQGRFTGWVSAAYDRLYDDISESTMASRRTKGGVRVARTDPRDLEAMSWDEYVPALMRAARNSSHGLLEMLREPDDPGRRHERLLLATNAGEVPASLFEVTWAVFLGLVADAEALCAGTW